MAAPTDRNRGKGLILPGTDEDSVRALLATPEFEFDNRARDWLFRRGEFRDADPSTPDREQVYPARQPPVKEQTEPWARLPDPTGTEHITEEGTDG